MLQEYKLKINNNNKNKNKKKTNTTTFVFFCCIGLFFRLLQADFSRCTFLIIQMNSFSNDYASFIIDDLPNKPKLIPPLRYEKDCGELFQI